MEENYKKRIEELEDRVDKLEKKEDRRKIFNIIKICLKIAVLILIGIVIYKAYNYAKTVIEPIREVTNTIQTTKNELDFSKISDWFKSFE